MGGKRGEHVLRRSGFQVPGRNPVSNDDGPAERRRGLKDGGRAWVVIAVGQDDLGHTAVVLEPVTARERADS
jgi:hypothetical protein